jgi:hypothetical protein
MAKQEIQHPIDILKDIPEAKNVEQPDLMFKFDGAWLPSQDGATIGPENFQKLVNMRYNDTGIEGVTGYTEVNPTGIPDGGDTQTIKTGIYGKTEGRTQQDHTLVQATTSTGQGSVYWNKTAIGSQGNFESAALHTDASLNLKGRFSSAPSGSVAYANGEEAVIWDGEEGFIGSAFTTSDSAEALPIDITDKMINTRTDSTNIVTISAAGRRYMTIMTRRPCKGFGITVSSANAAASTLAVKYWDGSAYQDVAGLSDGTASPAGTPFAVSGNITFTEPSVVLKHFEERYMYAYQIDIGAGAGATTNISEITCNMAMQTPSNIWDGIYRTPIASQVYTQATDTWEDYTLHVSEGSSVQVPVGCILDGFVATNDKLVIMFDQPMAGIRMTMLGNLVSTTAAAVMTVKYWSGTGFTTVGSTLNDGTDSSGAGSGPTFARSGLVSWTPPVTEEKLTKFGIQGYAYEITVTGGNLTGTKGSTEEVVIDLISGIPKKLAIETYKFPIHYKNKLLLCGYTEGNEGNRIDYTVDNGPDIFNGEESSLDGYQSIYVGGTSNLTCGAQLYNRFGSNLFASCVLFKNSETFLLVGDSPLDFKLYPVSRNIGCPAPYSLATAEIGIELGEKVARNVAMFVSNSGPMMYDGATLAPIEGLDVYFDPNESIAVNFDYLDISQGWFDSTYREYNIMLATGSSTTLNVWFAYDMVRRKWYQKDTGAADRLQCGFGVTDANGDQHIYAGSLVGKLFQLNNGASWAGTAIDNLVKTGDFFPSQNEWDITRIRRLKFSAVRVVETDAQIGYSYYQDTDYDGGYSVRWQDVTTLLANSSTAGVAFTDVTAAKANSGTAGVTWKSAAARQVMDVALTSGLNRLMRHTQPTNHVGWCHAFQFEFSSASTLKGMQPIMWGVQWEFVRKDHYNLS